MTSWFKKKEHKSFVQTVYFHGSLMGFRAVKIDGSGTKYGPMRFWENPSAKESAAKDLGDMQ